MSIFSNLKNLLGKARIAAPRGGERPSEVDPMSRKLEAGREQPEQPDRRQQSGGTALRHLSPKVTPHQLADTAVPASQKVRVWKKGEVILETYRVEDVKMGGMGYVYIAEHQKWKEMLAIKAPNEKMLSHRSLFDRVLREAYSWVDLGAHPHIAYCYYVRHIEDVPHIFAEYADGGNLEEWIADQRCYDLRVGLDLAIQFCHGMEYAHRQGMIHRDIKPGNILMTKDGILKVTDFGIARVGQMHAEEAETEINHRLAEPKDRQLTLIGTKMGSYDYMSPEQWEDPRRVDEQADIYSFGVCLYEMICGRKPYNPSLEVPASVRAQLENRKPYEPSELRADIPAELSEILKRCCALKRDERTTSLEELRLALTRVYRGLFGQEPPHVEVEELEQKADGLNNRGISFLDLGREEDAMKCWQGALKVDPQHLEATFNLGYLRWRKGEISKDVYITQMRELENSYGKSPDYWRCMAWILYEWGDIEEVEKIQRSVYWFEDEELTAALEDKQSDMGRFLRSFKGYASEGHFGGVTAVTYSPDGRYALSGSFEMIRLWKVGSGKEVRRFEVSRAGITSLSFSPDGRTALSGSDDKMVRLWGVWSGEEIRRFEGHIRRVTSVSFSPDGHYGLSGSDDKTARLWDVETGKQIWRFEGHLGGVTSVCFSTDGRYVLSGSEDQTVRLWELGREMRRFEGHSGGVTSVRYSPDGRYVLSGSRDNTIRLWEAESGKEIRRFVGHIEEVSSVSFSPDGLYILSGGGSLDKTVRLWELETGREMRRFHGHTNGVTSVSYSPDGRYALSGSRDMTVKLWEIYYPRKDWDRIHPYPLLCKVKAIDRLGQEREMVRGLVNRARSCMEKSQWGKAYHVLRQAQSISGYERERDVLGLLAQCGLHGKRSRLRGAWCLHTVTQNHHVKSVRCSPDSRYLLFGSSDKTLRLFDVESGKQIRRFYGHTDMVTSVSFSPAGRYALSGSADKTVRLWEVETGHQVRLLGGHADLVTCVRFSPDGGRALSGSYDNTVRLWDVAEGRELNRFGGHSSYVNAVSFSPDGRYILTGSWDRTVRLWEAESGREIRRFEGHTKSVTSVSYSPHGRYVLSGGWDHTIRLWDVASGKLVRQYELHADRVTSVVFSPDGRYALSGGNDQTVRLWEVRSGNEVRRFEGHTDYITSVAFSPDGRYALTGSWDQTARLWEFDWEVEFAAGG